MSETRVSDLLFKGRLSSAPSYCLEGQVWRNLSFPKLNVPCKLSSQHGASNPGLEILSTPRHYPKSSRFCVGSEGSCGSGGMLADEMETAYARGGGSGGQKCQRKKRGSRVIYKVHSALRTPDIICREKRRGWERYPIFRWGCPRRFFGCHRFIKKNRYLNCRLT